ncbi:MAG: ROK family transcriptional regulator [Gemmatimonadetes bacterium]|nr:ROK family transcriptional regulator [Gemmatimonadota bacterium]
MTSGARPTSRRVAAEAGPPSARSSGGSASSRSRIEVVPDDDLARTVLKLVWRKGELSRAEISRRTGRSRSTISTVVGRLLATGLVAEVGAGASRGGRRPILVGFQDEAGVILGVDVGATHVSVILTDLRGRTLAWREQPHLSRSDPKGAEELIATLGERCLAEWNGERSRLLGVGVAVPSPVDPASPDRVLERVLPAWREHGVLERLEDLFGVPVFVDNDANLGALAERWWGKAVGLDDFVYLKVATGVGAGLMIGGEVYRGATGVAGEIGHVAIDPSGPECVCGNRGCLATFVGTVQLVERAEELVARFPGSVLAGAELDIHAIEDAALGGDPLALQVVREAAVRLGIVVASVLNLLNPGSVILGGSLARAGSRLLDPLREAVASRTLVASAAASDIRTSELGKLSIALGAATHVLAATLANPTLVPAAKSA